jgi:hypothetical protein
VLLGQWPGKKWAKPSNGSTGQLRLRVNTALVADNNLFVLVHVNFCVVTVFNATCQNFLG